MKNGQAIIQLAIESILDDGNIRSSVDSEKMEELAVSMDNRGQLIPIIVREGGERADGTRPYRVISGHRRLEAAKSLGWKSIKAVKMAVKKEEVIQIQLVENLQREDMNHMDISDAVATLKKEYGIKQADISIMVGKTEAWVSQIISLQKLPEHAQERVRKGTLSFSKALEMLKTMADAAVKDKESGENKEPEKNKDEDGGKEDKKTLRRLDEVEGKLLDLEGELGKVRASVMESKDKEEGQSLRDRELKLTSQIEILEWMVITPDE